MTAPTRPASGLTLLELVLALALMGSVVLSGGWWMRTAAERASRTNDLLQRESATNALLDAIGRDLESGDLATDPDRLPKVSVKGGLLLLLTRTLASDAGAVVREYQLRPATGDIVVTERPLDAAEVRAAPPPARVVLGRLKRFDAMLDAKARTLSVDLLLLDGTLKSRRWALP